MSTGSMMTSFLWERESVCICEYISKYLKIGIGSGRRIWWVRLYDDFVFVRERKSVCVCVCIRISENGHGFRRMWWVRTVRWCYFRERDMCVCMCVCVYISECLKMGIGSGKRFHEYGLHDDIIFVWQRQGKRGCVSIHYNIQNGYWFRYGVATMSRMLKNTGLFAEYRSLL